MSETTTLTTRIKGACVGLPVSIDGVRVGTVTQVAGDSVTMEVADPDGEIQRAAAGRIATVLLIASPPPRLVAESTEGWGWVESGDGE